MTFLESKQHLARKLDIDYSDIANNTLFTDTDLGVFIQLGVIKAWDYKPWDFTEGKATGTTAGATLAFPNTLMSASIFLVRINSIEYRKLRYQDYLKYLQDNPSATDYIWATYQRTMYFNANSFTVGQSYEIYGKALAPVLSLTTDLLPFSPDVDNEEYSGNEAIVQLAYAEALDSEKKNNPKQAEAERGKAYQTLDLLWKPFADDRSLLQSKNRPFFDVPDFYRTRGGPISSPVPGSFVGP